jgi:nitric oxide reductase NorE protein
MTDIAQAGQPQAAAEKPAGHIPGQPDMWVLVLFEALVFTAYFAVYLFHRAAGSSLFLRSQGYLNPWLGTLDTVLLVTTGTGSRRTSSSRTTSSSPASTCCTC